MIGAHTKVPLREDERWEAAPAQEGQALLDHELNLNVAASWRRDRNLALDAIGPAGVVAGSEAFAVTVTPAGVLDLEIGAGRIWVDGRAALAPTDFRYLDQDQIGPLPAGGRALVYLDVWDEHIQPAEDPSIVDPALAPVETAARARVGYRVRAVATTATTCASAWAGFNPASLSTGRLTVSRVGPPVAVDPCDPPGDVRGLLPDGLLRVEVLDQGTAASARLAWSYENGCAAVAVAAIAGAQVTLQPSASVKFADDLVEVSWLARRADRQNAGSLYSVTEVTSSPGGDVLTLDRPVTAPPGAAGLVVRRWDGQVVGAAADVNATRFGNDLGVRFRAGAGTYRPGDWWGVRVREASGVEDRTGARPDGAVHGFVPLALVDLGSRTVLEDCRPTFQPLVDIDTSTACTVIVRPGESIQQAVDSLPAGGGEVCLAAGNYPLAPRVVVRNRVNVRIKGVGPATVLRSTAGETALELVDSDEVGVADLAVVAASAGQALGDPALNGALTFAGCRGVEVRSVHVTVPDGAVRTQTAITVRAEGNRRPERVRVAGNRLLVGAWQTAILVTDGRDVTIENNHLALGPAPVVVPVALAARSVFLDEVTRLFVASLAATAGAGTHEVRLPTGRTVNLVSRSPVAPLVEEFARLAPPTRDDDRTAFRRFARAVIAAEGAALSPAARGAFVAVRGTMRSMGQGVVVGGQRASTIRISGNVIRGVVQGIHVGVSHPATPGREQADDVVISGNTVHAVVPTTYSRDRHAVFVGNVRSVEVLDTRATAERSLGVAGLAATSVDGVRIVGVLGPFVVVRGASLSGFNPAVRIEPLGSTPAARVWSLSEVMAADVPGAVGAVAPPSVARSQVAP